MIPRDQGPDGLHQGRGLARARRAVYDGQLFGGQDLVHGGLLGRI